MRIQILNPTGNALNTTVEFTPETTADFLPVATLGISVPPGGMSCVDTLPGGTPPADGVVVLPEGFNGWARVLHTNPEIIVRQWTICTLPTAAWGIEGFAEDLRSEDSVSMR